MLESESHSSDETSYSTHGLELSTPKSYETLSTLSKLRRKYTICKYFLDVLARSSPTAKFPNHGFLPSVDR